MTIRVLWQPPQDDGGASVVNYTITVSPGLVPLTTSATNAMVTVPYSVMHTVSIVATNCNGSSSVVMETIPAIGSYDWIFDSYHLLSVVYVCMCLVSSGMLWSSSYPAAERIDIQGSLFIDNVAIDISHTMVTACTLLSWAQCQDCA